jgi:hypothetical protein
MAASRFHRSKIHALGKPVSDFIERYGYAPQTLERVEQGGSRPHIVAAVERDFAEYKAQILAELRSRGIRTAK